MSKPAILQVIPKLDAGGAERTTLDIALALGQAGYRALVASEGGRLEKELVASGAESIHLPVASKNPFVMYANIARLKALIAKENIALIHARSRAPAWSALYAAKAAGVPFVTTHHGIYRATSGFKRRYNAVMVKGDAVIANSEWTANHIKQSYGVAPKRIAVIPRGVDLGVFDPAKISPQQIAAQRTEWGARPDTPVILLPGRLTRWKGQAVLIEAAAILKAGGRLAPGTRFVLAGDDQGRSDYTEDLRNRIKAAGLEDAFILAGHVNYMPLAYSAADIAVSASTEPEAFGRIPPEAGAMERPVIATDHGGARETVIPGETGLLIPPGDAAAFADALADLLALTALTRAEMGKKGRSLTERRFSVARMCADTLALYRELLPESL